MKKTWSFKILWVTGLFICILFLFLYRLEHYPAPWFDEGLNFQAAKNIALHGRYGLQSSEGFVAFHPAIQTGPTVLLPMSLSFRLGDTTILSGRFITVLYAFLSLAVFYRLVRQLSGTKAALLALLILLFSFDHEFTSFVLVGRQALGEIPALSFFLLGTVLWVKGREKRHNLNLIGAGILWGMTLVTKSQFAIILPISLFIFWLFERVSKGHSELGQILLPLFVSSLCMLFWYLYQMFSLGPVNFWQQTTALGSAGLAHFLHFSPARTAGAISQLLGSSLIIFGIPGLLYTLILTLHSQEEKQYHQSFLAIFTIIWLIWYTFLSIGWMRYAFIPTALSTMFSAQLLVKLWHWTGLNTLKHHQKLPLGPGQIAVLALVVLLLFSGIVPLTDQILRGQDNGLQEFTHYLNSQVPLDAVIESWEWEVDLLTDHTFHHPPYKVTNAYTESLYYDTLVPADFYNPRSADPTYLIIGPFAEWTGVYSQELSKHDVVLVTEIGEYGLYRIQERE